MIFIKVLKYLFVHKYYVLVAGMITKAPLFNLLIHDYSKLLPYEFIGYGRWTFDRKNYPNYPYYEVNHHQKRNKHHWQYWVFIKENGEIITLDIPDMYIKEMVADWAGSGRSKNGKWDIEEYYKNIKNKILLSESTRIKVENIINNFSKVINKNYQK